MEFSALKCVKDGAGTYGQEVDPQGRHRLRLQNTAHVWRPVYVYAAIIATLDQMVRPICVSSQVLIGGCVVSSRTLSSYQHPIYAWFPYNNQTEVTGSDAKNVLKIKSKNIGGLNWDLNPGPLTIWMCDPKQEFCH